MFLNNYIVEDILMEKQFLDIIGSINTSSHASFEKSVLDCGLFPYLDWQLREFPPEHHDRCGKGIGLWQYPSQFSKYMKFIYDTMGTVRTYAEVGVAAGGTFMYTTEFLRRYCGLQKSYAVDIAPPGHVNYINNDQSPFQGKLHSYLENTPYAQFIQGTCDDLLRHLDLNAEHVDLLLIDGDHSYEGAKKDFDTLSKKASTIVFHDITNIHCPGVGRLWQEVKGLEGYEAHEFIDQYASVFGSFLGIGVICKRH